MQNSPQQNNLQICAKNETWAWPHATQLPLCKDKLTDNVRCCLNWNHLACCAQPRCPLCGCRQPPNCCEIRYPDYIATKECEQRESYMAYLNSFRTTCICEPYAAIRVVPAGSSSDSDCRPDHDPCPCSYESCQPSDPCQPAYQPDPPCYVQCPPCYAQCSPCYVQSSQCYDPPQTDAVQAPYFEPCEPCYSSYQPHCAPCEPCINSELPCQECLPHPCGCYQVECCCNHMPPPPPCCYCNEPEDIPCYFRPTQVCPVRYSAPINCNWNHPCARPQKPSEKQSPVAES
ncbi:unnamed protein product [Calicophoron daubneyi]|uniref:Uncharacterized protein n=1 Tax=Calicophoron daubneyi TaxID=300641 RepID=A0AAV2TAD3_CALDB